MSRLFPFVLAFLLLAVLAISLIVAPAKARCSEQVMFEILHERGSPLAEEAYTLVAFRRYHGPDFNMINFVSLLWAESNLGRDRYVPVSYTHLRAHETVLDLVCRLLL